MNLSLRLAVLVTVGILSAAASHVWASSPLFAIPCPGIGTPLQTVVTNPTGTAALIVGQFKYGVLDFATRRLDWALPQVIFSQYQQFAFSNNGVVAAVADAMIMAIDVANGTQRWATSQNMFQATVVAAEGDAVFGLLFGADNAGSSVINLVSWQSLTGVVNWNASFPVSAGVGNLAVGSDRAGRRIVCAGLDHLAACFDLTTGILLWATELPTNLASVNLDNKTGVVVFLGMSTCTATIPIMVAFDATTGRQLWNRTVDNDFDGLGAADGTLFLINATSSQVVARDVTTGKHLWSTNVSSIGGSQPVAAIGRCHKQHAIVLSTDAASLTCLHARTGAALWHTELPSGEFLTTQVSLTSSLAIVGVTNQTHSIVLGYTLRN